jgi:hypothetical protein
LEAGDHYADGILLAVLVVDLIVIVVLLAAVLSQRPGG